MSVAIPQDHAGYDDTLAFRDRYRHAAGPHEEQEHKDGDERKHASEDLSATDGVSADQVLEAFGYTPELARSRSTLQVAFMSFVLAAIPYGLATTFFYPLAGGGATNIIWGWVGVSAIILCVAASLGEITSVYPTSGGVYYQTFMLAPVRWRRVASWICGWLYVVGNITITLSVNFGTALFLVACINVFETDGVGIFPGEPYQVFLVFLGITLLSVAISSLGNRWLPLLDVRILKLYSSFVCCTCECLHNHLLDGGHLLDVCRRHCHGHLHPRDCQERAPQCALCLYRL